MQRPDRNDPRSGALALLRQGLASHQRGELDAAARLYRQVLRLDPRQADAHNLLGVLARQRGDLAAALRHGAEALALRPGEPVFLANQGAALAEAGQLPEAVRLLRGA